ncbi:MAG: TRAP transporter substrate-binding protein [Thermodesulfobacteriota bacterium]
MKSRTMTLAAVVFLAVLAVMLIAAAEAPAAKKIQVATVALPETTIYQGLEKWKKVLEERSKGSLTVHILGRAVMGGDREMIEGCRLGTLETAVVSGSVIANIQPEFFMVAMPYLFNDHPEANAFLDGAIGQKLFKLVEAKGLVGLGWATWSFRGVWNNVRPVTDPEALKGLKIRTVETPLDMSIMNSMGGVATPMAWSECLLGLKQGTVDGISTTYGLGYALKLYELAKFASRTNHYYESAPLIMSKQVFDGLTPEERKLVKETAAEAMRWSRMEQGKLDDGIKEQLEAKGVKVNYISKEAFEAFRGKTKPLYEQFRGKIGAEFMDEALKVLETSRKK